MVRKPNLRFYVMVGVACGLGVLAVVGTVLLFVRDARQASNPAPPPPQAAAPAASRPDLPLSPASGAPTPALEPASAARVYRTPKQTRVLPAFKGTVSPPEPETQAKEPAASAARAPAATSDVDAAGPGPEVSSAPQEQNSAPEIENGTQPAGSRSSGKIKRVFGSMLKPFRGKKPAAEQ
jgi:hypothetical protein